MSYALYTNQSIFASNSKTRLFTSQLDSLLKVAGTPVPSLIKYIFFNLFISVKNWCEPPYLNELGKVFHQISVLDSNTQLIMPLDDAIGRCRKEEQNVIENWCSNTASLSIAKLTQDLLKIGFVPCSSSMLSVNWNESGLFLNNLSLISLPNSCSAVLPSLSDQIFHTLFEFVHSPFVTSLASALLSNSTSLIKFLQYIRAAIIVHKQWSNDMAIRLLGRCDYIISILDSFSAELLSVLEQVLYEICTVRFSFENSRFPVWNRFYVDLFSVRSSEIDLAISIIQANLDRYLHRVSWASLSSGLFRYSHSLLVRAAIHTCHVPISITLSLTRHEVKMLLAGRKSRKGKPDVELQQINSEDLHDQSFADVISLVAPFDDLFTANNSIEPFDTINVELSRYTITTYSVFAFVEAVRHFIRNDCHQLPHILSALVNEYLSRFVAFFQKPSQFNKKRINSIVPKIRKNEESIRQMLLDHRMDLPSFGEIQLSQLINSTEYYVDKVKFFDDVRCYVLSNLYLFLFKTPATKFKDEALSKRIDSYSWIKPSNLDIVSNEVMEYSLKRAMDELQLINMHRDPKLKMLCIARVIEHCIASLSLATGDLTPGADALLPVLVN